MTLYDAARWRRIEALLDEALGLQGDARSAFLREACGSDEALRREIEALIAAGEAGDSFLRTPAAQEAPQQQIGRYRLARELGRGGMGVVYLAERVDFEQRVALKLVRPGLHQDPLFLRRFLSERQILAQLEHANIARLLDGGVTPEGLPYFVMEYVDGVRIDEYCNARALGIDQRIALFVQVCAAVASAHERTIVHRDLKCSNILVTGQGTVKLLDFGIAKLLQPDEQQEGLTRTNERLLTPEYASPEQLRGAALTPASDVYALGVILYELLTGRRPYGEARTVEQLISAGLTGEPPAPSTTVSEDAARVRASSPERLRRSLRGDLDAIVLKALSQDARFRYANAGELQADLRRFTTGQPVRARADVRGYRLRKFVRRQRAVLAVGLLGVLGGAAAFALSSAASRRADGDARVLAVGRIVDYRDPARPSLDPLTDMLATNLARAPGVSVVSAARMYELLRETSDVTAAAKLAGATHLIEGSLYANEQGRLRLDLKRIALRDGAVEDAQSAAGADLFALADSATAGLLVQLGASPPKTSIADVTTRSLDAYELYTAGLRKLFQLDSAGAGQLLEGALQADSNFAMAAYYSARTTGYNWRSAAATAGARNVFAQRVERALRLADRASDRERLIIRAWWARNHFAPELRALADTLVVRYPHEVEGYLNLGVSLLTAGNVAAGAEQLMRAVALDSAVLVSASAGCAACEALRLLTEVYGYVDSVPAAERTARRWVRLQPQSPVARSRLAEVLDQQGRFADAEQELNRAAMLDPGGGTVAPFVIHWLRTGAFERADSLLAAQASSASFAQRARLALLQVLSLRHQGRFREALVIAERLRAATGGGGVSIAALAHAQVMFDAGEFRKSAVLFDSIAQYGVSGLPESVQAFLRVTVWSQMAAAKVADGDTTGLAALADRMERDGGRTLLSFTRSQHQFVRGMLYAARGDKQNAEQSFHAARASGKAYNWPSYELADLLMEQKRALEAVEVLRPAVRGVLLETGNFYLTLTELHQRLALAWELAGRADSAALHYKYVAGALRHADPIWQSRRDAALRSLDGH